MIFYFSGTGNTKFVADFLADALCDEAADMGTFIREGRRLAAASEKPYVFLAPIYAWRFPRPVEQLIKEASLSGCQKVYCIATRESQSGRAGAYMKKIIVGKGMDFRGFTSVNMPNQYLLSEPISSPKDTKNYLVGILPELTALAGDIRDDKEISDDGNVLIIKK